MEEGKWYTIDKGTPQVGIISLILANIYVHYVLDLWMRRAIIPQYRGIGQIVGYAANFAMCA